MTPLARRCACVAALALACRTRHRVELPDGPAMTTDVPVPDASEVSDVLRAPPRWPVRQVFGPVRDARGVALTEDEGLTADRPVFGGRNARVEVSCGASGEVSVWVGFALAAPARDDDGALVLGRGEAVVDSPMWARSPVALDTPAGRVIVASGRAWITVADDGSLRVRSEDGAVTVWPAAEDGARRAVSLRLGETRAWSLDGHPLRDTARSVEVWRAAHGSTAASRARAASLAASQGDGSTTDAGAMAEALAALARGRRAARVLLGAQRDS